MRPGVVNQDVADDARDDFARRPPDLGAIFEEMRDGVVIVELGLEHRRMVGLRRHDGAVVQWIRAGVTRPSLFSTSVFADDWR